MNEEHLMPQVALKLWPFLNGAGRITDRLFSGLTFQKDFATVKTSEGFCLTVDPNDHIGRHIYLTGAFDRSVVSVLLSLAREGDCLWDIGAHIGYVSACFLHKFRKSTVVAFEPNPPIFSMLKTNLSQFEGRATELQFALSNRDGGGYLKTYEGNSGASRLADNGISVEIRSVKSVEKTLKSPDLVKIDTEGHEQEVINSLLTFARPRAIIYEDQRGKSAPNEPIGKMLSSSGYKIFAIKKQLTRTELKPILSPLNCTTNDYLAVLQGLAIL